MKFLFSNRIQLQSTLPASVSSSAFNIEKADKGSLDGNIAFASNGTGSALISGAFTTLVSNDKEPTAFGSNESAKRWFPVGTPIQISGSSVNFSGVINPDTFTFNYCKFEFDFAASNSTGSADIDMTFHAAGGS